MEPALGVDSMQPATHLFDSGAETGERSGLEIDVTKFDDAGPHGAKEPAALPFDAGITDGAFGVVPDGELRKHAWPVPYQRRAFPSRPLCRVPQLHPALIRPSDPVRAPDRFRRRRTLPRSGRRYIP